jgi:hypothetical protein
VPYPDPISFRLTDRAVEYGAPQAEVTRALWFPEFDESDHLRALATDIARALGARVQETIGNVTESLSIIVAEGIYARLYWDGYSTDLHVR